MEAQTGRRGGGGGERGERRGEELADPSHFSPSVISGELMHGFVDMAVGGCGVHAALGVARCSIVRCVVCAARRWSGWHRLSLAVVGGCMCGGVRGYVVAGAPSRRRPSPAILARHRRTARRATPRRGRPLPVADAVSGEARRLPPVSVTAPCSRDYCVRSDRPGLVEQHLPDFEVGVARSIQPSGVDASDRKRTELLPAERVSAA